MPLYRPYASPEYRIATGGTGLEGLPGERGFAVETHAGSTIFLEGRGVVAESEVFRIPSGSQFEYIIPQGERVVLVTTSAPASGGLIEVEQEAIDAGRGVVEAVGPVVDPITAQNAANAEAILAAQAAALLSEALAEGLRNGSLVATGPLDDPNTQIIPAPPPQALDTAPPPPAPAPSVSPSPTPVVSETPAANPEGSTSQEAAPVEGCETRVTDPQFGPSGELLDPGGIIHFDGSQWSVAG